MQRGLSEPQGTLDPRSGSRLAGVRLAERYQVLGPIGAGGMGEVFVAHDTTLERPVAIKRLRQEAALSRANVDRLRNEARLNAQLQHPNIVTVYDVVQLDGVEHIVSELVDGDSLRELVGASRPSLGRALEIAIEVVRGLEFAHSRKVIHRDLKTENVLVGRDGAVKIADFGIALLAEQSAADDEARVPLGTPRAMSPEQSMGEPTDERSDLFSLGVLIYEIVGGASPFLCANAAETMRAVRTSKQRPLADLHSGIPVELSRLVDRLLEKQRTLRPFSASEVLHDLVAIHERVASEGSRRRASSLEKKRVAALWLKAEIRDAAFAESALAAERFVAFQSMVAEEAAKAGGGVVSVVGGEIAVCFGHVETQEHDCERAAALALHVLSSRDLLVSIKAGLDIGDVFVSTGDRPIIVGPTIEQAARLARAVGPGELVVTTRVQSRIARRYHLVPRPLHERGAEAGADLGLCYEVVGASHASPEESVRVPIVGRDALLTAIRSIVSSPKTTRRRVVALRGEAGVGKSRIVGELREGWAAAGARVHVIRGTPETQYSPFGALRPALRAWFGLDAAKDLEEARARVAEGVSRALGGSDSDDTVAALSIVCGCARDSDRTRVRSFYQREQRREVEDAVVRLITDAASRADVVVIAEDAHWFDHSSWDVMLELIAEPRGAAVVATYRPDFHDDWAREEGVTVFDVERLDAREARRMVGALAPAPLPDALVDRILESSAGLPLVLEELTRASVARPTGDGAELLAAVFSSLGDQVAARLEPLSPSLRRTIDLAAVLGLSASRDVLCAATGEGTQSAGYVGALVDRGLLRTIADEEHRIGFSHPLVREEVLRRMDDERRVEMHRRVVDLFDANPAAFGSRPETLAHHCQGAGLYDRAVEAWHRAGVAAAEDGAHPIALQHFERALTIIPSCSVEQRAFDLEAAVRASRGASLAMAHGWGAEAVTVNNRELAAVLRRGGAEPQPMSLWQEWAIGYATGNMLAITKALAQIEDLVATSSAPGLLRYLLHSGRGITYLHLGRLPQARQSLEAALAALPEFLPMLRELGQPEPIVTPAAYLAWVELLVGDTKLALSRQSAIETDPSFDAAQRSCAASFGTTLFLATGDVAGAVERANVVESPAGVGLALQHHAAANVALGVGKLYAAAKGEAVDVVATIDATRASFETWRGGFMRPGSVVQCVGIAEGCLAVANAGALSSAAIAAARRHARELLDFALHEVTVLDPGIHRYYASEIFRADGLWHRSAGDSARAAAAFREARTRAQRVDAGEAGGAWFLLDRIARASEGEG